LKVLIELPTWLGDCVMTTPSLYNILNSFTEIEIGFIGSEVSIQALQNFPRAKYFLILQKKFYRDIFNLREIGEYDFFISYRGSFRSIILGFFVSARKKYRYQKSLFIDGHQVEKYNNFINSVLGLSTTPHELSLLPYNEAKVQTQLKKIGINPGAAYGNAKMWTKEGFAEVIAHLSKENKIIIFGAKCENFYTEADEGKFNFPNIVNLSGRTNVQELVSEISDLDLFITGDSGPMHIAAAFQIPTISIFGPTKFQETSQWKNKFSKIIKKDLECQPCMKRTCPLKHHNCMKLIKPEEVLNEYQSLLREIEID